MKKMEILRKPLSPALSTVSDKHIHGVDKFYRMFAGLSSYLLSYENGIIELEIRFSKRWPKPVEETALQLANSWRRNDLLQKAKGYHVHLYKRIVNPGIARQTPNQENKDAMEEFCKAFVAALKASADDSRDEYLTSIRREFKNWNESNWVRVWS